jgi:putative ABC transport system permease protein
MLRDAALAIRALRRSPGFVVTAAVCLGVGLGVATTAFAMLDAVLRPYVPYRDTDNVFVVASWGDGGTRQVTPRERLDALRTVESAFAGMVEVEQSWTVLAGTDRRVIQTHAAAVGPEFFPFLGLKPAKGRFFQQGDGEEGAAVVTEDLWYRLFPGERPGQVHLTVENRSYPVVGVLPRGTLHPWRSGVLLARAEGRRLFSFGFPFAMVRLRPGQDSAAAAARLEALAASLEAEHGIGRARFGFRLNSLRPDPFQLREIHRALAAGSLAVLLIACANLANLLLARGVARRHDLVLNVALGATRGAIARQLLAEAVLLSAVGAALGVLLTLWGADLLRGAIPARLQGTGLLEPQISWRIFGFGIAAAVGSAALFGVLPAVQASDVRASEALRDGAGTTTRRRSSYSAVVVAEFALTLILLVGTGLMVRSIGRIAAVDLRAAYRGLVGGNIVVVADSGRTRRMVAPPSEEVLALARSAPGVLGAAIQTRLAPWGNQVVSEESPAPLFTRGYHRVSPDFVEVRGLEVLEGRGFLPGDASGAGAAIIDSLTARKLWPDGRALGRRIKLGPPHTPTAWISVVGVTRPAPFFNEVEPYGESPPEIYVVQAGGFSGQGGFSGEGILLRVEPGREAGAGLAMMRAARDRWTGERLLAWFAPWSQSFEDFLAGRKFIGRVFAVLALLALALAVTGLYAVISHTAGRRMREFAIRVSLGATRSDIRSLVVRDAAVMVLGGTAIGGLVALWTGRFVDPWLYGVFYVDAVSLVAAEAVLLLAAAAAVAVPARRALRASPADIIRAI